MEMLLFHVRSDTPTFCLQQYLSRAKLALGGDKLVIMSVSLKS